MKSLVNTLVVITMLLCFTAGLMACSRDTPAEKAAKKLERALDDAKKKAKNATD